jgi:hypothetical protein
VRSVLLRRAPLAVFLTVVALLLAFVAPIDRELLVRIYALVIGALALVTLSAATTFAARQTKSPFVAAMRRTRVRNERPEALERLERQAALALENAADFHFRLRPSLVEAADAALWRRHGVQLERAQPYVSAELWALIRPDLAAPEDRRAPGPPLARVESLVDEIERMRP